MIDYLTGKLSEEVGRLRLLAGQRRDLSADDRYCRVPCRFATEQTDSRPADIISRMGGPTSWAVPALQACLDRLAVSTLTEASRVRVIRSWVDSDAAFCVVYRPPFDAHRIVGLRRHRSDAALVADLGAAEMAASPNIHDPDDPDPVQFGQSVADFDIGVPLGSVVQVLRQDQDGVGWRAPSATSSRDETVARPPHLQPDLRRSVPLRVHASDADMTAWPLQPSRCDLILLSPTSSCGGTPVSKARQSTRSGTTAAMFSLAWLSAISGVVAGVVFMVHTSWPGCTGWVGCGTHHPDIGIGVLCILAGLVLAAVFAALALIARAVGETQATLLASPAQMDLVSY